MEKKIFHKNRKKNIFISQIFYIFYFAFAFDEEYDWRI